MLFKKFVNILNGKLSRSYIWDLSLFVRRTFTLSDGNITVPSDKVLQMHSPYFECELIIDGEVYIL